MVLDPFWNLCSLPHKQGSILPTHACLLFTETFLAINWSLQSTGKTPSRGCIFSNRTRELWYQQLLISDPQMP